MLVEKESQVTAAMCSLCARFSVLLFAYVLWCAVVCFRVLFFASLCFYLLPCAVMWSYTFTWALLIAYLFLLLPSCVAFHALACRYWCLGLFVCTQMAATACALVYCVQMVAAQSSLQEANIELSAEAQGITQELADIQSHTSPHRVPHCCVPHHVPHRVSRHVSHSVPHGGPHHMPPLAPCSVPQIFISLSGLNL